MKIHRPFHSLLSGLLLICAAASAPAATAKHTFTIGTNDFLLDGQRLQIRCGEIHAPRVPKEYWRHRLQMCKAMGLNTVCAYLFWNMHEPRPGEFNWSGEADAAEFCRIAQEEGLWVLLRPGPYSCAEWDMGGFPAWLLKHDDIKLRTRDPRYLEPAKKYLREVGRVLAPLQVSKGGPILMVQVENEYGFYGKDTEYIGELRQALVDGGFDVPLFSCNPPYVIKNGHRPDLFPVVNFGSDPAGGFKALRGILPQGPLMCGEFYPGWFDNWGAPHHFGNTAKYINDLEYMLKANGSFSIYMAHGGTSFGFMPGANHPYKAQTSSYDYDAPISEAGWVTEKFFKTRELFSKYLLPGETIPAPPAKNPIITIAPVELKEAAPIFANLPRALAEKTPRNFEQYDQFVGCINYRTTIPAGPAATIEARAHDFGQVYLDGQRIGFTDRRSGKFKVRIPERKAAATLDVFVEAMGHINFGTQVHDPKGILGAVKLGGKELTGWQIFNLPLDDKMLAKLKFSLAGDVKTSGPAFWRGSFTVETPGDTFLDMRPWGKGYVWVNGRNLGRYWNIGPQQTMYLPAVWLRPGKNEIIVLDFLAPEKPVVAGNETPILNQLRPELDFSRAATRPKVTLNLGMTPVHTGTFAAGAAMQEVKFAAPASGRYFCIESLNAHDGQPFAAIAELSLLDTSGRPLDMSGSLVAYVDSEERSGEDGTAENAIDGQTANFWHTEWKVNKPNHPHRLMLDLGKSQAVSGFRYVPRQGDGGGKIKDYRIFAGDNLIAQ